MGMSICQTGERYADGKHSLHAMPAWTAGPKAPALLPSVLFLFATIALTLVGPFEMCGRRHSTTALLGDVERAVVQGQVVMSVGVQCVRAVPLADAMVAAHIFDSPVVPKPPDPAILAEGFVLASPCAGEFAVVPMLPSQ